MLRVVYYYIRRWQIQIYFHTLKSGCRIECRLFEKLPRTLNCVAVYSIIAGCVMYLCDLGRECPELDCELVFSPSDRTSVYSIVHGRKLPETPPRLNELIQMIANLGGYIDRPKPNPAHNPRGRNSNDSTASHSPGTYSASKHNRSFFLPKTCVVQ